MDWLKPVTLTGQYVTLVPLQIEHLQQLQVAVSDGELWKLWFTSVPEPTNTAHYIEMALAQKKQGQSLPFAVIDNKTGQAIGSSRYCNIDHNNKRLEIGYTWYAKKYQRSAVNSEAKLLLLEHAFEQLKVIACEFRTHWHNQASRNAIARLGAKQDGILRQHLQMADGSYRDTVVFSIINSEWLAVKKNLLLKLNSY